MCVSVRERNMGKRDTLSLYQESLHERKEGELQYSDLEPPFFIRDSEHLTGITSVATPSVRP